MRRCAPGLSAILILIGLDAGVAGAHPGAAIAVSKEGVVYFVDTGAGVFSIQTDGRLERREGPAFHWFAFDPDSRFRKTSWPSMPNAEFRSAGADPTLVLSSDFPVTIGTDGKFYYPDGSDGKRGLAFEMPIWHLKNIGIILRLLTVVARQINSMGQREVRGCRILRGRY